ncbi:hypothetical protein BC830DRAFT_1164306 [Chytriomyces sp. MP71]|nr:hypothetical protein BC830DRAFT_1164306 [Chytriomyces sp. MP71]
MAQFTDATLFPSFDDLPEFGIPDGLFLAFDTCEPTRHWCFVGEIASISFVERPRVSVKLSPDRTIVVESNSVSSPTTFAWTDLRPGNSIAILYATRRILSDGSFGIRADDLGCVTIFRAGLEQVTSYGAKLTRKQRECFHHKCARKSGLIVDTRMGNGAAYCSASHQIEGFLAHRFLYAQSQDIKWLLTVLPLRFRSPYVFASLE